MVPAAPNCMEKTEMLKKERPPAADDARGNIRAGGGTLTDTRPPDTIGGN